MADMPREPSPVGGVEAVVGKSMTRRGGDGRKCHDTSFLLFVEFSSTCSNTNLLANGKEFVAVAYTEDLFIVC
jgi:hypothetical protein